MNLLACLLLAVAVLVDIGNAWALLMNIRHARRGVARHASFVPVLAQLAAVGAGWISTQANPSWIPPAVFWIAGLADAALFALSFALLRVCFRRLVKSPDRQ